VNRAPARIFGGLVVLSLCACAPALRQPPSVADLAGAPPTGSTDVDGLLAAAAEAYAGWTLESVRDASTTWFEAAAADPARVEAWIGAARAGVWLAGHEPDPDARDDAARAAVQSAQLCAEAAPGSAACSYWLAVALGVQARERRATALDALPRMVDLLEQAAAADPEMERAGPHRVLALVLVRAPGWPTGPGDPDTGVEHARRAVALAPDFAPNLLCLAEALDAVDETDESRALLERAREAALRGQEAGDPEAGEWLAEIETATTRGWGK